MWKDLKNSNKSTTYGLDSTIWPLKFGALLTNPLVSLWRPTMCRNIRTLFNFDPPATELEIRDASLQFVRKLSGFAVPSKANEAAFEQAVADVAATARQLMASLTTTAEPRDRAVEAAKARARSALRFGQPKP